jgi:hypothetical protein
VLEQLQEFRIAAQTAAFALLALAAWRWGGGPERALAAILVWFRVADWTYHGIFQTSLQLADIDLAHFVIDAIACAAAFAVALYANRIYPLWFAAVQLLVVFAHLARELAMDIHPLVYAAGFMAPSYLQIIILGAGIWLHRRRERKHGPYRAWRLSSNHSPGAAPLGWPNG